MLQFANTDFSLTRLEYVKNILLTESQISLSVLDLICDLIEREKENKSIYYDKVDRILNEIERLNHSQLDELLDSFKHKYMEDICYICKDEMADEYRYEIDDLREQRDELEFTLHEKEEELRYIENELKAQQTDREFSER